MPQDIDAYAIARTALTKEEGYPYVTNFNLTEIFKEIEGAKLNELILFFCVEDNEDNRTQLEMTFGKKWRNNFVRRLRLPDNKDDIKESFLDTETNIIYDSYSDIMIEFGIYSEVQIEEGRFISLGYHESMYKYFAKEGFFKKLNNEKAGVFFTLSFDLSTGYNGDSWFKSILAVVAIIVITYLTAGSGTYAGLAYFSASIAITATLTETELPVAFTIILTIIGAVGAWGGATLASRVLQVANLAIEIADIYESMGAEKEIEKLKAEQKALEEEMEATQFGRELEFTFGSGFYKSYLDEGVHKDPYQFIHDTFNPYRTYKNTSYNMWDQID